MSSLGEAFFEVLADTSEFGGGLESAIDDAVGNVEATISGAMGDVSGDIEAALGEAGQAGGEALTDGVDAATGDLDIDVSGVFDDLIGEAEGAANDVAGSFEGVGEQIGAEMEAGLGDALDTVVDKLGTVQGALGTVVGGAGLEAFARGQQDLTVATENLARMSDIGSSSIRDLATDLSNATFPLDEVLGLMEIGSQRGLEGTDALGKYATFWDMVGDATGENSQQLAASGVALERFGVAAGEEADALAAFGFITEETTGTVGGFLSFMERMGTEIEGPVPSVNEMAAALGVLEDQGLTAQRAQRVLQRELRATDGDLEAALETLGVTPEAYAEMTEQVDLAGGTIEGRAEDFAASRTTMQRLQSAVADLGFKFGEFGGIASTLAAPVAALGPAMLGLNQGAQLLSSGMGSKLVGALKGAAAGFKTLAVSILTNPIFLIGALIIGIIAVIWHFRDEIIGAFKAAWDWVAGATTAFWSWLTGAVSAGVTAVSDWFGAMVDAVVGWISDLVSTVTDAVTGWVQGLVDLVAWLFTSYVGLWAAIISAVVGAVTDLVVTVVAMVSGWVETLVGFITQLWEGWQNIAARIRESVIGIFGGLIDTVVGLVRGWISNLLGFVRGLRTDFFGTIRLLASTVVGVFTRLPGQILRGLGNLGRLLVNAGKDIIRGLISGITGMAGAAASAIGDVAKGMVSRVTGIFRSSSPSKAFGDLGEDAVAGLAVGVAAQARNAVAAIGDLADRMLAAGNIDLTPTMDVLPVGGRGGRPEALPAPTSDASRGGAVVTLNPTIVVRDEREAGRAIIRELRDVAYLFGDFR